MPLMCRCLEAEEGEGEGLHRCGGTDSTHKQTCKLFLRLERVILNGGHVAAELGSGGCCAVQLPKHMVHMQ